MTNDFDKDIHSFIDMIGAMASLDFSKRLEAGLSNAPSDVLAHGLNMLSEELEANVVKKSRLDEINDGLEKFSYTVAHDIRSPLNSAIGIISLIEMELGTDVNPNIQEYLSLLKQVHQRIADMVKGILDYSKTDFNTLQTTSVNIGELCREIHKEYPANKLHITIDEQMPVVEYNRLALWQVMSNLIGNAVKYNDKDRCEVHIGFREFESVFEISLEDNGPGIDASKAARVFDLFENFRSQEDNSYGVGLSIVKKIVNQADGEIWLESNPGSGAKFVFTVKKQNEIFFPA